MIKNCTTLHSGSSRSESLQITKESQSDYHKPHSESEAPRQLLCVAGNPSRPSRPPGSIILPKCGFPDGKQLTGKWQKINPDSCVQKVCSDTLQRLCDRRCVIFSGEQRNRGDDMHQSLPAGHEAGMLQSHGHCLRPLSHQDQTISLFYGNCMYFNVLKVNEK